MPPVDCDLLLAEDAADIVAQIADHGLDDIGAVDLQQNVRATLQIEAERQESWAAPRTADARRAPRATTGSDDARHDDEAPPARIMARMETIFPRSQTAACLSIGTPSDLLRR